MPVESSGSSQQGTQNKWFWISNQSRCGEGEERGRGKGRGGEGKEGERCSDWGQKRLAPPRHCRPWFTPWRSVSPGDKWSSWWAGEAFLTRHLDSPAMSPFGILSKRCSPMAHRSQMHSVHNQHGAPCSPQMLPRGQAVQSRSHAKSPLVVFIILMCWQL